MLPIDENVPLPTESAVAGGKTAEGDPLALPGARKALAKRIAEDIDAWCQEEYDDGHRNHLGASLVGHECRRYLWNVFRWLKHEKFSGRMLRLFQRGHLEEQRFMSYLKGIGCEVVEFQPDADGNANKGEQQYRIKAVMGHFGGSLDGQVRLPEKYGLINGVAMTMLAEYKTKGTGRGFTALKESGVIKEAPQHYAQMCMYGRAYGYKYAIYMCVNKNDDDLHVEVVELDWKRGEELERKAFDVITAQYPPEKIAATQAFHKCKMCNFKDVCFNGEVPEKNCRSCLMAKPIDGGQWLCQKYQQAVPADFIKQGCDDWSPITNQG